MLSALRLEALISWESNVPTVSMSGLRGALLDVGVEVGVVDLELEDEELVLVLECLLVVVSLWLLVVVVCCGEGEGLALGEGDGEGLEFPPSPPKLHDPCRTPRDSEPKKLNNP